MGTRLPAHASALGKVLLAGSRDPEAVQRLVARHGLPPGTPRTITTADDLQDHLVLVGARGWGLDDEEYAAGLRCLAAPVRDAGGEVVAAIGISGPTTRVTLERVADPGAAGAPGRGAGLGPGWATPARTGPQTAARRGRLPPEAIGGLAAVSRGPGPPSRSRHRPGYSQRQPGVAQGVP